MATATLIGKTYSWPVFTDGSCVVGVRVTDERDGRVYYERLDGCKGGSYSKPFFLRHAR